MRVHRDLQVGREILKLLKQLYELVLPHLPEEWRSLPNDKCNLQLWQASYLGRLDTATAEIWFVAG